MNNETTENVSRPIVLIHGLFFLELAELGEMDGPLSRTRLRFSLRAGRASTKPSKSCGPIPRRLRSRASKQSFTTSTHSFGRSRSRRSSWAIRSAASSRNCLPTAASAARSSASIRPPRPALYSRSLSRRSGARSPLLANPFNTEKGTLLTPEQFQYAFTYMLTHDESKSSTSYTIACADRVLFEGAFENFAPHSPARVNVKADRPPILLIAGGEDHLVPADTPARPGISFGIAVDDRVQRVSRAPALHRRGPRLGSGRGLRARVGALTNRILAVQRSNAYVTRI